MLVRGQGSSDMLEINHRFNLDITLKDEGDRELVICSLENGDQIKLTLDQARVLACKLIMEVSRAEVRRNLKHEDNISRKVAVAAPQPVLQRHHS
jgi:hypothetical protein